MTSPMMSLAWEAEELYWQDGFWDDAVYYEHRDESAPDEEYEEVFATYLDARRRFADLKAARGFWPVMAVPPSSSGTPASPTPSYAPSKKRVENPKEKVDGDPSFRRDQHRNELLRQLCASGVARPATTVMHVQIHLRKHPHQAAHNLLRRKRRPRNPSPVL